MERYNNFRWMPNLAHYHRLLDGDDIPTGREQGVVPLCSVPYSPYNINHLPDEVLARIFGYLRPIEDRLPSLALVCHKWRHILLTSGFLWRSLHIDPSQYSYGHFSLVCCIFRLYGYHVQKLTWREHSLVYESVFSLIARLRNLKYLRLPILWTRAVVESLQTLTNLEHVQINGGYALSDTDLERIGMYFPRLREVSINACWSISSQGVERFIDSLRNLETIKLKINSGLPLNDVRSERAMREGGRIVTSLTEHGYSKLIGVLCLHFVPVEMDQLWDSVNRMSNLKKLSISNCEHLHGIRLVSKSLQKLYLFNLWNVLFISVDGKDLRYINIDDGLETMEHLELYTPKLRRARINGSNVMKTISIKSNKLSFLELSNCEELDMRSLRETLKSNPSILCLKIGCLSQDSLLLDELIIPSLHELCLLSDFACEAIHIRSPTLRLFHTEAENDIITLNHIYITANHICKIALVGMPALKTMTIQCVSVDSIELNLCSDEQIILDSCVIHAMGAIGFLRLFDCKLNLLSVSTPVAETVVLYRCQMTNYVLQMALNGCHNISHLNLEKCKSITQVSVDAPPMMFLNMFGCREVHRLDLDCPQLLALNLGQCPNVRLFLKGVEQDLSTCCDHPKIVSPTASIRWSHHFPPLHICGL
ncbi:uncharacterized protein [Haliotis cracherodii]|uniref:uncharacterized protein n=1 Tax=Haliotis cracherodii TaxID=6455 RepID=UPI0039EA4FCA